MTTIIPGNIIDVAERLKGTVQFQSIITSPPYWMLRNYGTPPQFWPGHPYIPMAGLPAVYYPDWTGELGMEPDVNMFIGHLVFCFQALRPLLRDDGVLYINLGDSYIGNCKGSGGGDRCTFQGRSQNNSLYENRAEKRSQYLKSKQRVGVPWRFAMAMQAAGWYWRDEIIWAKKSPMPGSQKDRCTVAHEVILMFSKKKRYFWDRHAIHEPCTGGAHHRGKGKTPKSGDNAFGVRNNDSFSDAVKDLVLTRNPRSVWTIASEPTKIKHFASWPTALAIKMIKASTSEHGCCSECGAPWQKVLEMERHATRPGTNSKVGTYPKQVGGWAKDDAPHTAIGYNTEEYRLKGNASRLHINHGRKNQEHNGMIVGNRDPRRHITQLICVGWEPTCKCNASIVPCKVLDPFGGTGKTALAAERLHRDCTLIELNEEYASIAKERLEQLRRKECGELFANNNG